MESLLATLRGLGVPRLVALVGAAAGVVAVLAAIMLRVGAEPKSLLYANLDLKEAGQITQALDAGGIKYELKGDGATILVDRDKVAPARLMLSSKGLPTSGSVGYEIFDNAPALGQTDFVQNLNMKRALEGELARTIRAIRGVDFARVFLVLPKHQLFDQDETQPSASIMVGLTGRPLAGEQVRAIRNLVAGAVPNLKPDKISITDQTGQLLAAGGEGVDGTAAGSDAARATAEDKLRRTVLDIVQGVVGPGRARVQVTADVDESRVTTQEEKFDPDGQVVRSTQTGDEKSSDLKPTQAGSVSAAQNLPGATGAAAGGNESSNTGKTEETTNYEISKTTRTQVEEPGRIKKVSVAVAVDGVTGPSVHGKPGPYTARTPEEMRRIEQLVRSAVGYDQARGDQVSVVNVRFEQAAALDGGTAAASPFSFDKNDVMRAAELGVLLVVAGLVVVFVARPVLSGASAGGRGGVLAVEGAAPRGVAPGGVVPGGAAAALADARAAQAALAAPAAPEARIDIARIEGAVKASTVKQVAEFVERHPDESVSILRSWLHEA